jgi:hypothetical protein
MNEEAWIYGVVKDYEYCVKKYPEKVKEFSSVKKYCNVELLEQLYDVLDVFEAYKKEVKPALLKKAIQAITKAEETHWKLSCGCPTQYGGIPAEWATIDRDGSPAVAYGVICEKHWHEYDAQHPQRAWQGLTAEEIEEGWYASWVEKQAFETACWWANSKLKEKNT